MRAMPATRTELVQRPRTVLKSFAVVGLAAALVGGSFLGSGQAAEEPLKQKPRVTDDMLRSVNAASVKAMDDAPAKTKERVVRKEISGEVVATTKRTLSLEIGRTANSSEEMLFPVDPATVKLERIISLADLQRGDRVQVQYHQTFRETDEGEYRLVGTLATKISLLSRATGGQMLRSVQEGGS